MDKAFPKRLKKGVRRAVAGLLALASATVAAAPASPLIEVSFNQLLEIKTRLRDLASQAVVEELGAAGINPKPIVTIELTFDDQRLQADAKAYYEKAARQRGQSDQEAGRRLAQLLKQLIDEQKKALVPAAAEEDRPVVAVGNDVERVGMFNLGASKDSLQSLLNAPAPAGVKPDSGSGMSFSVQLPAMGGATEPLPFSFDAYAYLTKLEAKVSLPFGAPATIEAQVRKRLITVLDLGRIARGADAANWVTFDRLAKPPEEAPAEVKTYTFSDWLSGLWQPGNNALILLLVALLVGGLLFGGVFLGAGKLAKGMSSVAKEIGALKPAGEAEKEDAAEPEELKLEAEAGKYDKSAVAQALTSEMKTVREQFRIAAQENAQLIAELVRDMLYSQPGRHDFRNLMTFVSYEAMRPTLAALPKDSVEQFQDFMAETRDEATDLLRGVEVAQSIVNECVSRMSGAIAEHELTMKLRIELLKIEDERLFTIAKGMDPSEVAYLLKILSSERGNRLMLAMPAELIKSAAKLVGQTPPNAAEIIASIAQLLAGADPVGEKQLGNAQKRLILRMAKGLPVADEPAILGLIEKDDWEVRRAIMGAHFLMNDVRYLPEKHLRTVLGRFTQAFRAEVLTIVDATLRATIMGLYKEGTKQREMLDIELDSITKSAAKTAEVRKRTAAINEKFVAGVRAVISVTPALVDEVILAICRADGLTPPPDLAAEFKENKDKAAA